MIKKILPLILTCTAMVADTLTANGKKYHGRLTEFSKGTITFMEFDKDQPTAFDLSKVARINLTRPTKADFMTDQHSKKPVAGTLRGYRNRNFYVILKGQKKKISPRYLDAITINVPLDEFAQDKDAWENDRDEDNQKGAKKAKAYAEQGKITIVHFHDGSAASTRQGNLCQRLQQDAPDLVTYIKLKAPLGSPIAKLNRLRSTPQFWFYSKQRKLMRKLDQRFTEEDIEMAMQFIKKSR